jgi:hypothetical protein
MTTTIEALKNLYVAHGGQLEDVADLNTTPDLINALAGYVGIKDTGVQAEKGTVTLFGTKVSNMQTNVQVADNAITGTLKFIQGGLAQSGPLAGDGNFLALKFIDNNEADSIKVGLVPSASGMDLVELDSDMNGVFKVSGEVGGVAQVFKVVTEVNGMIKTQIFDLSGLLLEEE